MPNILSRCRLTTISETLRFLSRQEHSYFLYYSPPHFPQSRHRLLEICALLVSPCRLLFTFAQAAASASALIYRLWMIFRLSAAISIMLTDISLMPASLRIAFTSFQSSRDKLLFTAVSFIRHLFDIFWWCSRASITALRCLPRDRADTATSPPSSGLKLIIYYAFKYFRRSSSMLWGVAW